MPVVIIEPENLATRRAGALDLGGRAPRGIAIHTSAGFSVVRSWNRSAESRQTTLFGTSLAASASEWFSVSGVSAQT